MALERESEGEVWKGWSGGWEERRRGSMGDGGGKYCCVLLESGGFHGDRGKKGRDELNALNMMQIDIFAD